MDVDLSFWRFVIVFKISKTFLFKNGTDTHWIHIGTFCHPEVNNKHALKIVFLSLCILAGFADSEDE